MANTRFNFDIDPYYDDFQNENGPREQNYMRILFRPGYAVQARELTQLQSILQNQIKQFGDHIFQDGSPVEGGHITLDVTTKSLKLEPSYNSVDINLEDFDGNLIKNDPAISTTEVRATVLAVDNTQVLPTIVVKYLSGNEFNNSDTVLVANTSVRATTNANASYFSSNSSIASINEGVFYVDGYFVYVAPQTIILEPYNDTPSYRIGLQIVDGIIDESDDSSLLDPAQESFNYQAPGATRYQYNLELAKRSFSSTDDSRFFELLRVENGIITKQVRYPIYSELEKTLARRTYDESGDYTVKPFRATVSENQSVANTFKVNIEPGKAYIKGYEFETIGTVSITNDKANTSNVSNNYSFSLDYGNYVLACNVYSGGSNGFLDVLATSQLDLHAVQTCNINTSNSGAYSNTKIGTARVRNIDYASSTEYYVYLTDINTAPVTANASGTSANLLSINLASTFSDVVDAYKGAKIKISSGPGADSRAPRTILSYSGGSTKVALVDYAFPLTPNTQSQYTIIYSFDDVDSLVAAPGVSIGNATIYYTQSSSTPWRTCMDISLNGKSIDGKAILYDKDKNKLYYELPQNYVTENQFSDVEYYRKTNTSVSFVSNTATISPQTGGSWFFGNGTLSALTAKSNFVVVNRTTGLPFNFGTTGNTITQSGGSVIISVDGTPSGSFTADIIATERVLNPVSIGLKSLVTASSTLSATDSPNNANNVYGTSGGVKVDYSNGHVWFTNSSYILRTPNTSQSLYMTDVVKIVKVFDSGNLSFAPNSTNKVDITDRYILDGGQKDNYYDYASIKLRDGYAPPTGQTAVFLQYFNQTGGSTAYFSSYSYGSAYANNQIPNYATQSGIISLRDTVDFRPRRKNANTNDPSVFALEGTYIPSPEYSFNATYNYYVPRSDKLVVTKDREFKILKGTPGVFPTPPKVPDDAMVLYNIYVPAYTANVSEIGLEYIENKRYTMKDIGNLEKRIENLEYYTSLNVLELQAKNETILYDDNQTEKEKYGIIADDFSDFAVVDTASPDLAINITKAKLAPYRLTTPIKLNYVSSTNCKINERTVSLNYSEEACIVQDTATKSISVQPFEFAQFHGSLTLYPETDYWYSKTLLPEVIMPGSNFVRAEQLPGSSQTTSAPEINPSASIVNAPTTTGIPSVTTQTQLPADGFGAIRPIGNWFGIGLNLSGAFTLNLPPRVGTSTPQISGSNPAQVANKPRINVGEIYTRKKRN